MEFSVENVCGLLIRSKLLTSDGVKTMYQRWLGDAKEHANNLGHFTRWLVAKQYVTEYQATLVAKGHADDFFIHQYKILDRLGRGRMAGVYKALHQLGQVVAIKILPPSKSKNTLILARFQRESRLAVRLKHPNVVRSFQVGQYRGLHYLVMEYLEGETLDDVLLRRKKLPPNEAVRLIYQALMGLQHIHEQGLVHRDLKPANLMLVPRRASSDPDTTLRATVKILDIGLGRTLFAEETSSAEDSHLTGEGVLLGTPDYLAPEQARDPRSVDIRADIYSLGCVLYHTLTGQPPFPDTNLLSQMVRHATEVPRPLKELNPAVPDGLQQILNWMLAKDPGQRYPTPERAAQALQVFLASGTEPARASDDGPGLRRYLTWLETSSNNDRDGSPAQAAAPSPKPPLAIPVAAQPPAERAGRRHGSKKHKRHKHAKAGAAGAHPQAAARPEQFDVELVPATIPPGAVTAQAARPAIRLSKREWLLVGIASGATLLAVIVGIVFAKYF
jgi:eukaryotic-like serine/threonine-protein kinase